MGFWGEFSESSLRNPHGTHEKNWKPSKTLGGFILSSRFFKVEFLRGTMHSHKVFDELIKKMPKSLI